MPRALLLGEFWHGSTGRACARALQRLDCDVLLADSSQFIPSVASLPMRISLRFASPLLVREYNRHIKREVQRWKPDFVLAFKNTYVAPEMLRAIRRMGVALFNYYPDTSPLVHGGRLRRALSHYDVIFHAHGSWGETYAERLGLPETVFLPHGYDPEVHRPLPLTALDLQQFGGDVVVIATYTPHKEFVLDQLLAIMPALDLHVWGNQWKQRCRSAPVRRRVRGMAVTGDLYAKVIKAARINLALLSGRVDSFSRGDETTTRTFEIPAVGGFMIHERMKELFEFYEEDREVVCFESVGELAEKIEYFLQRPEERRRIAEAGHRRCVPAYSYDRRMEAVLERHRATLGS